MRALWAALPSARPSGPPLRLQETRRCRQDKKGTLVPCGGESGGRGAGRFPVKPGPQGADAILSSELRALAFSAAGSHLLCDVMCDVHHP